jgi:hypothetical protein
MPSPAKEKPRAPGAAGGWLLAAALAFLAGLRLLAAGCSGDSLGVASATPSTTPATATPSNSGGGAAAGGGTHGGEGSGAGSLHLSRGRPGSDLDPNTPQFRRAETACRSLLPPTGKAIPGVPAGRTGGG